MPFIEITGFPGKVYVPEPQPNANKKNPCRDCFSCQHCADIRCQVCLNKTRIQNTCQISENHPKNQKADI
jgi:hypothetical protein